jgi:hypothetical protein
MTRHPGLQLKHSEGEEGYADDNQLAHDSSRAAVFLRCRECFAQTPR